MTVRYDALQDFFLTRFHEDWQEDSASRSQVVAEFVSSEDATLVEAVISDARGLLAEELPEEELHDLVIQEYSLSFDPWRHEITMGEWMRGLLRELLEASGGRSS